MSLKQWSSALAICYPGSLPFFPKILLWKICFLPWSSISTVGRRWIKIWLWAFSILDPPNAIIHTECSVSYHRLICVVSLTKVSFPSHWKLTLSGSRDAVVSLMTNPQTWRVMCDMPVVKLFYDGLNPVCIQQSIYLI